MLSCRANDEGSGRHMSGDTITAIGAVSVRTASSDINAVFRTIAAEVAQLPPEDIVTYDGHGTVPAAPLDGHGVLFIPSTATGVVTVPSGTNAMPLGYAAVVVADGSKVTVVGTSTLGGYNPVRVVGDGFDFQGYAESVVSGAGVSNVEDDHSYSYGGGGGGGGSDHILVGGTGKLVGGQGASFVAASGSKVTINATTSTHNTNAVTVETGAAATVAIAFGNLTMGNKASVIANLGTLEGNRVQIGTIPGTAPVIPPPPPTVPSNGVNAANPMPVFTNEIAAGTVTDLAKANYKATANYIQINDAQSVNLLTIGLGDRVDANTGTSTIFGSAENAINVGAGSVFFVGGADSVVGLQNAASTIVGGTANTTVFATAGDVFNVGTSLRNVFVGGASGASTINVGTGGGEFFGGSHGDLYNAGTGPYQLFIGQGGSDTINGGVGTTSPTIYALNAEKMTLTAALPPVTLVAFTHGGVIDASGTSGGNVFFAGYGQSGSQTLVGSTTGSDVFVAGSNPASTDTHLVIADWHAGDVFYLTGASPADVFTMDNTIANNAASGSGDLSYVLSDKTLISFVGDHPTNFADNAAF